MRVNCLYVFVCEDGEKTAILVLKIIGCTLHNLVAEAASGTPVREHVARGRITYWLSATGMMWHVMYFVIKNLYFFSIHIIVCRGHISYILVLHFVGKYVRIKVYV